MRSPFELKSLIGWLEKQPAEKEYRFLDCSGGCLIHSYITSLGLKFDSDEFCGMSSSMHANPGFRKVAVLRPRTFGAALQRARLLDAQ